MNREQIIALQKQLIASGDYDGPIDGIMGPKMQAAITASQARGSQTETAKANAAAEAAKAQGVQAQQGLVAATNKAENDRLARERQQAADKSLTDYQNSGLGQGMGAGRTLAPFVGVGAGYADSLVGRKFLGVGKEPLQAGIGKRMAIGGAFGVPAAVAYGLGRFADNQADDTNNTHLQHDIDVGAANLGYGMSGGNITGGALSAAKDIGLPDSLGPKPVTPAPAPPDTPPGVPPSGPADPFVEGARALGAQGIDNPSDAKTFIQGALKSGNVTPAQRVALRDALGMTSPNHTFTNALKGVAPGAALFGAFMGADAASNYAHAQGVDPSSMNSAAAPVAGAIAGGGAAYGGAKGMGVLGDALMKAFPTAAEALSRATPVVGGALTLRDMMSATPRLPPELEGRAASNPDVRAQYFKGLRDANAQQAQAASQAADEARTSALYDALSKRTQSLPYPDPANGQSALRAALMMRAQ